MTDTIKTILLEAPGKIALARTPLPRKSAHEALIRVESVGICGSDVGAYRGTNPLVSYPRIIGHEVAGVVVEGGDGLPPHIAVGDRVIVDPYIYCGICYPCSIGRTNCCERLRVIGVHVDGGMRELFAHPARLLHKATTGLRVDQIPLAEPLTIALHALHRTRLKAGEHVAIIGAGAIGLMAALAAISYGATPILIDIVRARLDSAHAKGVRHTIDASHENPRERVRDITGGRMAEVVVEASGANQAIRDTLDLASFAGRIAFTGWPKQETALPTNLVTLKELDIYGSRTSVGEFAEALDLLARDVVRADDIVSQVIAFDDVPRAVRELSETPDRHLKINAVL
ncbi:MAG: alcohol dehydrogenase catalytic domain-containing protein [Rhodocyclaceae bacterium]